MGSLFNALQRFLAPFEVGQHRPNRKFLRDALAGILMSHSLILSAIGRVLEETDADGKPRRLIHTVKRLSRNLNSDRLDDDALHQVWWETVESHTMANDGEGVVIGVDYTDIAKPFACLDPDGGMQYACQCRDGSTGTIGTGYPVAQIDACLPDGNHCPVLYRVYSADEPGHLSEPDEFISAVKEAAPHVGSLAWWTLDRGFDSGGIFRGLDEANVRWITRLKVGGRKSRHLIMADGTAEKAKEVALQVIDRWTTEIKRGKGRKRRMHKLTFGSRKVWLKDSTYQGKKPRPVGDARTLVVVWGFGKNPLVLLANQYMPGRKVALEILRAYRGRWGAEESTRFLKDSRRWGVRVEDLRALKFRGVQRLVMLALIAYLFVLHVQKGKELIEAIASAARCHDYVAKDTRYRILRGTGKLLSRIKLPDLWGWTRCVP